MKRMNSLFAIALLFSLPLCADDAITLEQRVAALEAKYTVQKATLAALLVAFQTVRTHRNQCMTEAAAVSQQILAQSYTTVGELHAGYAQLFMAIAKCLVDNQKGEAVSAGESAALEQGTTSVTKTTTEPTATEEATLAEPTVVMQPAASEPTTSLEQQVAATLDGTN